MNFTLKSGNSAIVLVVGPSAFKWFHGRGAEPMLLREKSGYKVAGQCPVWATHLLPMRFCRYRTVVAPVGQKVPPSDPRDLSRFVTSLVKSSIGIGPQQSALELLPIEALEQVLWNRRSLFEQLRAAFEDLSLPAGPTHGDLHRGNILSYNGNLRVIDLDRFRSDGCPLFDLLHFHLSEAQRGTGMRWLDFICERPEIVDRSTLGFVDPDALFICYAAQRIAHEGQGALLQCKPMEKYAVQAQRALLRLTEYRREQERL